jgi:hypothetical protein
MDVPTYPEGDVIPVMRIFIGSSSEMPVSSSNGPGPFGRIQAFYASSIFLSLTFVG